MRTAIAVRLAFIHGNADAIKIGLPDKNPQSDSECCAYSERHADAKPEQDFDA